MSYGGSSIRRFGNRPINPWLILQTVSRDRLKSRLAERRFKGKLDTVAQEQRDAAAASSWFQERSPKGPLTAVAYFSMEFMLSEALAIYSGGLGNVAGDLVPFHPGAQAPLEERRILWQR